MNMNVDEIDISILSCLRSKARTTTEIAKLLNEIKDRKDLLREDSFIRQRVKRLVKAGVVKEDMVEGRKTYKMRASKCRFGDAHLTINGDIKLDLGKVVLLNLGERYHVGIIESPMEIPHGRKSHWKDQGSKLLEIR